jgi:excisionase family DNA binding protein
MTENAGEEDQLLSPARVAKMFGVSGATLRHWAENGTLPFTRTLGGHRRFREIDVRAILTGIAPLSAQEKEETE